MLGSILKKLTTKTLRSPELMRKRCLKRLRKVCGLRIRTSTNVICANKFHVTHSFRLYTPLYALSVLLCSLLFRKDSYSDLFPPPGPDDPETLWEKAKKDFSLCSESMDALMKLVGLRCVYRVPLLNVEHDLLVTRVPCINQSLQGDQRKSGVGRPYDPAGSSR